jgi:hypothetical protein
VNIWSAALRLDPHQLNGRAIFIYATKILAG